MTSEPGGRELPRERIDQLYVWVWLPGRSDPVVAGVLTRTDDLFQDQPVLTFTYARSYRANRESRSLFTPELPLRAGTFDPTDPDAASSADSTAGAASQTLYRRSPLPMHGCLRDAAPDAWGRRVINLRRGGNPDVDLDELTYLRESSSDRIGALDFQDSSTTYVPRQRTAALEQLLHVAELVEAGSHVPDDLAAAAGHGTSIGGARPKAVLDDGDRHLIAKFSSTTDTRPVVKAEAAAMLLAARAGIDVAPVEVRRVDGKDVLLVERFDRTPDGGRRAMVSALTVLGRHEMESRYGSYAELAEAIRVGPWAGPKTALLELFTRLVFNVCVGNNDDHLRNHAAFWDGAALQLTPAYDVCPSPRATTVSSQAIGITRDGQRSSQLRLCREVAKDFLLSAAEADASIDRVLATIRADWIDVCDQAQLSAVERDSLWGREVLNPYIFYDQP